MLHLRSFTAAVAALAVLLPLAARADEDPIPQAFAPELRAMLARDNRCGDARTAADKYAGDLTNVPAAVEVIKTIDRCLKLARTPTGWEEYTAYLLTANAAATLAVARLTNTPRLYERARAYAEQVPGYSLSLAGGHENVQTMQRTGATGTKIVQPDNPDPNGRALYKAKNNSVAEAGPAGVARIASEIGAEATAALKAAPQAPKP
jgi:hypothetical protein